MGILYILTLIILGISFMIFKKTDEKINFIKWLIIYIVSLLGYNILIGMILGLLNITLHIWLLSIINLFDFIFSKKSEVEPNLLSKINELAKYSMPIYLFHEQVIYLVIGLLNYKLNIYILSIICFTTSIILSYIISKLLFRWSFTRLLIGEKV